MHIVSLAFLFGYLFIYGHLRCFDVPESTLDKGFFVFFFACPNSPQHTLGAFFVFNF